MDPELPGVPSLPTRDFRSGVLCVAIWKLSVPRWVQNGTEDPVLLDCEYVYNENDVRLVVKWFFNDMLEPVYQWIPELNARQTSGILSGRLDDSFKVGGPKDSQYRALRIIRPTTELSGRYTCVVSSMAGHDSREQSMMVYEVHCGARGLHPRPTLRLFSITPDMRRTEVQRGRPRTRKVNGTYDIELSRSFGAEQLPPALTFECVLEIPGTDYEVRRRTVYNPASRRTCGARKVQRGRPRTRKVNGTYDIELSRSFGAEQLPPALTFECVLEIPGTDYEVRRRTVYNPDRM
ncbi:conserved hypothetical protein [Ixodes scapularis]|uniref:Ig-like domain-containing protein n=1 Tax=Ixodes scapularis TaxID=6945 RepID=B7PG62_IXOSC|nr:conserved hypothetical protein [Ixodes scapularis]|eukprot:XP_002434184.1 conserved hypothetical protein [Ixodes scapularis]